MVAGANVELLWYFEFGFNRYGQMCEILGFVYMKNKHNKLCLQFFCAEYCYFSNCVNLWDYVSSFQIIGNIYLLEIYISLWVFIETDTDTFCYPYESVW